ERVYQLVALVGDVSHLHRPLNKNGDVPAGGALDAGDELEIGVNAHIAVEGRVLGQITDPSSDLHRLLEDVKACDLCRASGGGEIAGEDAHRRSLACTVWTEKAQYLALADVE